MLLVVSTKEFYVFGALPPEVCMFYVVYGFITILIILCHSWKQVGFTGPAWKPKLSKKGGAAERGKSKADFTVFTSGIKFGNWSLTVGRF